MASNVVRWATSREILRRVTYDLITVGGGLAGAALGRALAQAGRRVLIVEREARFRDRVRGEYLEAWGVAEAHALDLIETLARAGAREMPWITTWVGGMAALRSDVRTINPGGFAPLCLSHPAMQEAVLAAAEAAGAEVLRPALAVRVTPGSPPAMEVRREDGRTESFAARLVVGADGRESKARSWGGFDVARDPEKLALAGLLLDGYAGPDDTSSLFWNFPAGEQALFFPQGGGRLRAYVAFQGCEGTGRLSGRAHIPGFLAACAAAQVPAEWLVGATPAGPLAAFQGADVHVPHPYRDGLVLLGDAAACSDPTWGCGLSLTLRGVRTLRDRLLASDDWEVAAHAYAVEHDRYYGRLHTLEGWLGEAFFETGPEADARRGRILGRALTEPGRIPDVVAHGPDAPCDEAARRRFFAED
jgi:2-polyprenyl-6-methoxyphenol hydroxylase-like FAD-dependent oxidoreductase